MAVSVTVKKALRVVYKRVLLPNFNKTIGIFIKDPTYLSVDEDNSIYCTLSSKPGYKYRINFGMGLVYNVFDLNNTSVGKVKFKSMLPDLKTVFLGAYFHEVGHLVFTAMSDMRIAKLPSITFKGNTLSQAPFVHMLFNILEDQVIEYSMRTRYKSRLERSGGVDPRSVGSLLSGNREIILKEGVSKYEDVPNSFFALCDFLLLRLSFPKTFTGVNSFYDAHPENKDYVLRFLKERDATKRIDIVLEYWAWLLTSEIEIPRGGSSMASRMPSSSAGTGSGGLSKTPSKAPAGAGTAAAESLSSTEDEDEGEGEGEGDAEPDSSKEGKTLPPTKKSGVSKAPTKPVTLTDDKVEPIDIYDPNDENVFGELNDKEFDWSIHTEVVLKDLDLPIDLKAINSISYRMMPVSEELSYYFMMLRERSKPSYIGNLQNGSALDLPAVRSGERLNIFKELLDRKKDKITGITLLCDNSGSMKGDKSSILQHGVIAMSQMMDRLGISFSVHAFSDSESEMNVTFTLKDYSDDFNNEIIFNNFNLLSSYTLSQKFFEKLPYPAFWGNRDGYHIEYVSQQIDRHNFDNKVMIIFSDGAPASDEELNIAMSRHPDIHYIGIGICDSSVRHYYREFKVFKDIDSLADLPKYLGDLLLRILKD